MTTIYKSKNVLRCQMLKNYKFVFKRTMFIRSINKPNSKSVTKFKKNLQPYNKFFVLDFEATCDNGIHLIKPQVVNNLFYFIIFRLIIFNHRYKCCSYVVKKKQYKFHFLLFPNQFNKN